MGCTASKIGNEDTVRRCKERRRLMKDAVQSRHHLASAHSDYLRSLLSTAAALSRFASGEPLSVSSQTPPILLHHHAHPPAPPPPLSSPSPSPSPSPSILTPPPPSAVKIPRYPTVNSNYAATPSQSSSAWDWENFYPPSPPDSEFFERIKEEREQKERENLKNHHLREEDEFEDDSEDEDEEEGEEEQSREEIHCSEWGHEQQHHCSSSPSSTTKSNCDDYNEDEDDGDETEHNFSRSNRFSVASSAVRSEIGSGSVRRMSAAIRRERSDTASSSSVAAGEMRMVVRHKDLVEIVEALREYFEKAAAAGEQMSEILETGRAQLDRSFRQLRSECAIVIG